jgi:hypothetical protein
MLTKCKVSRKTFWQWGKRKPKTGYDRNKLLEKCGSSCFLLPKGAPFSPLTGRKTGEKRPAFPICPKDDCCIDCGGLRAAYIRGKSMATQTRNKGFLRESRVYARVSKKALTLAKKLNCDWAKRH